MVFREQTILQVRSFVNKLEKEPINKADPSVAENAILRHASKSVQEERNTPRLPNTRHARSCLASGLFHAVYKCRLKKVKFLLDNGSNINGQNDYGYSVLVAALHIENDSKRRKMFQFLLEHDADPIQKDPKYKRTALGWAAVLGRNEQVDVLLDLYMGEFDFHEKDRDGMTALHLATQAGYSEVVRSLVREMTKYRTSVDVPDNLGLTPYLHAKRLGYGLIADILKEEGGASEGQGDMYTFKRADEWREIGIRERNAKVEQRRLNQFEQAAIAGSARMLSEFEGPGYEIISIPTPKRRRKILSCPSDIFDDTCEEEKDISKTVRIKDPRTRIPLPAGTDDRYLRLKHLSGSLDSLDGRGIDPLSLVQMRPSKKGIPPKHFRSSIVDESKAEEYKRVLGDLTTMMDYLSLQHTKSFRSSVPPLKPKVDEEVNGKKKSTMAIIFGKNKKGRKSPRQGSSSKKKAEKGGSGKGKRPGSQHK